MIGPETVAFLESGCSLIVGSVSADGLPHASRGWGLDVLDPRRLQFRLLLDADDTVALANLAAGGALAVTGASVRTLYSMQLKGRAERITPATIKDVDRAARFIDEFFTDIQETDGDPRERLERIVPVGYVACTFAADEIYDQTPGPGAGEPFAAGRT